MKERRFVKLRSDMYSDTKFKIIDTKPERDTIHYIWTRLLTLAARVNLRGDLFMSRNLPYTIETLAIELNRSEEQIKLAIDVFLELEMIELVDGRIYRVKNFAKHQNIKVEEKAKSEIKEINAKNNKYIKILIKYTDNQSKYKLFQYNKKEKIFNYVCDILQARSEKEKHFIVSQEGKIFVIDDCIYSMQPTKDYNKIFDIFFEEDSIICLLKRNSINKKIIFYNNKTLKEIESKTTKTFNVGNLVFFEHKNNFNVLLNKQELAVKRKCEIIKSEKHFSKIYDDGEFQLYETKSFENDKSNLVMINKIKQEVDFYLKKGEIIKTEDKAFFIEKGYLNIFENKHSTKKGIKSIQINNSDNLIKNFTYKDDKIYLIEKKSDRFYLMIYDVLNDKIIKETNVNNLCFIPEKFIDDYEYLNNVTEEALQKNFLLNKYGSEQE